MSKYLIWSFEHGQWWGPNRSGYTRSLGSAGRYSAEEAGRIATNSVMGEEVALLEQTARLYGAPTVRGLWQSVLEEAEEE